MAAAATASTGGTGKNTPDDFSAEQSAIAQARQDRAAQMAGAGLEARQATAALGNRDFIVKQSVPPRRYVYGETRIGGAVFFEDNENPWLLIGVALSDGEIDAVTGAYFGAEAVPLTAGVANSLSRWAGKFKMETTLGTSGQAASAEILAKFPALGANFRQRGVARAVFSLAWGENAQEHSTVWGGDLSPAVSMRGVKVFDTRDGAQSVGTPSTWLFSKCPPLQVAHAITHVWGAPVDTAAVDYPSIAAAANICDTASTTTTATPFTLFTSAGEFKSGGDYGAQITDMLTAFGGSLYMSGGKYIIKADQPEASIFTVTDDDILGVSSYQHEGRRRDTPTSIKARYYDTAGGTEALTVTVENAAAVAAEGLREKVIDLPFTDNALSAQVLAYRALVNARAGRRLSVVLTDVAMFFEPTERITVASASFPVINGEWRVSQFDVQPVGVLVQLVQYDASAYANPNTYVIG